MYKNRQHPTDVECRLFCCPILLGRCRFCSFLKLLSYWHTPHILLFFIGILMIGTSYVNLSDLTVPAAIACGIYILVMFVYTQVRYPYVKAKQEKKEDK